MRTYFAGKPVLRAYIFGSFARGEADQASDIDLLVDVDYNHKGVGFEFIGMMLDLQEMFGKKVDLIPSDGVSKYLEPFIEKDKALIYER